MGKYKILKDLELVIQYFENEMDIEIIKQLKLEIINHNDFNPHFKFLIDVRKSKYNLTYKETKDYRDFVSEILNLKGSKKSAIVTNTPKQVANALIITSNKNLNSGNHKICSTLEAAISWLNIDFNKLDTIFSELNRMTKN